MAYKLLAGAPFDPGNIFFNPATDPGLIVNPFPDAILSNVDGGFFTDGATEIIVDGGLLPLAGTASYDPNKDYGPLDIVPLKFDDDSLSFDNVSATFDAG